MVRRRGPGRRRHAGPTGRGQWPAVAKEDGVGPGGAGGEDGPWRVGRRGTGPVTGWGDGGRGAQVDWGDGARPAVCEGEGERGRWI